MRIDRILLYILCSHCLTGTAQAADALSETQTIIQEWVRTEQLISQERRQWEEERPVIGNILQILDAEREGLNEQISRAQEITSRANEERTALVEELSGYEATSETLESRVIDYERQLSVIANYLPAVLREELAPRYSRIGASTQTGSLSLSERSQAVFSIMAGITNFDSRMTLTTEVLDEIQNQSVEVRVLYFGLARAFYVNNNRTIGGYGVPSENGWQWYPQNDMSTTIGRALDIHETRVSPQLIGLPMEIDP
jgi:chromosome segregation ATPase